MHFLRKTIIIQWNAWKRKVFVYYCFIYLLLLANKLIEEKTWSLQCEGTLSLVYKKKKTNSVRQSKTITYQPRTFQNLNIADVKLINTERPQTSYKLSKSIRQIKKSSV